MNTPTTSTGLVSPPLTATGTGGDTVAEAIEVSRVFGKGDAAVRALDHVSVAFTRGRLTAIMGPSGSGKSTLMHCMAGLDVPTEGRILIEGNDIGDLDDRHLTTLRRDQCVESVVFDAHQWRLSNTPTLVAESCDDDDR